MSEEQLEVRASTPIDLRKVKVETVESLEEVK